MISRLHSLMILVSVFFSLHNQAFSEEAFLEKQRILQGVCQSASPLDINGDALPEIQSLKRVPEALRSSFEGAGGKKGTLILLVEERLFQNPKKKSKGQSIIPALIQYAQDLRREGWDILTIRTDLYRGKIHQDGRIILAIREVLRGLYQCLGDLRGAILIGNFPDAYLVRQYFWKKYENVTLMEKGKKKTFLKAHYWRNMPEPVADRSDIVLADLDGEWDQVYYQKRTNLGYFKAVFPHSTGEKALGKTNHYEFGHIPFEDFFFIHDGWWESKELKEGGRQFFRADRRNDECSPQDLKEKNPMARPEIFIGRINTYHIAVVANPLIRGIHGRHLLSKEGKPQTLTFKSKTSVPHPRSLWIHSEELERKLLNQYFLLNHRYRKGDFTKARKAASLSTHWHSSYGAMKKHIPSLQNTPSKEYDLRGGGITLADTILWLRRPALFRVLKAHSDPWGCVFGTVKDEGLLRKAVGGPIWGWHRKGNQLIPGYGRPWRKLDFPLFRALYENGVLPEEPSLYLHTGCSSISPSGAARIPYSHPQYGHWQHAESLIFYCRGLVLIGRAKVFNDEPRDFFEELGKGKTWGEAWMHYFLVDSQEKDLNTDRRGISRKRAYFWSLVGDPTLRVVAN